MKKTIWILWIITLLFIVVQSIYYYAQLPAKMASHFDVNGNPNQYSSKNNFYIIWYLLVISMNMWVPLMKTLIRKLPPKFINIPNKAYWLSDDKRRNQLTEIISTAISGIFASVNMIMLIAFYYTVQVNLSQTNESSVGWMIIVLFGAIAASIFYLIKKTHEKE